MILVSWMLVRQEFVTVVNCSELFAGEALLAWNGTTDRTIAN